MGTSDRKMKFNTKKSIARMNSILQLIKVMGALSPTEIGMLTGTSANNCKYYLKKLYENGSIIAVTYSAISNCSYSTPDRTKKYRTPICGLCGKDHRSILCDNMIYGAI